jgi:hypothetical protein
MRCTPGMVEFKDDGREIHVRKSDCLLVQYWASKYGARVKVAWTPKEGGSPLLLDHDVEQVTSLVPGPEWEKGDTVWAVPSSTMGAFHEASLIERLVSTASAKDYEEIRRSLSEAGCPDDVLDAAPTPR